MSAPAPQPPPAEEGFILIEVLVSALILAIVAGAVLSLIAATTHSAASERTRATAYGLAQEDQARLRTMRIASLNDLEPPPFDETIGGTNYTIEERGKFVNNTTGTSSCSGEGTTADYIELTSTVSSDALLHPVSIHSIVSPSNESLDPSHGTFAFQAKSAAGEPLAGVSFSGTGAGNFNGHTDEEGCVTFADVPAGNYQVTTSSPGRINPEGLSEPTLGIGVEASGTTQHAFAFDFPGTIEANFYYKEPNGSEPPAAIDSMELFESENEEKTITFGTPGGPPPPPQTLKDASVYPFKTPYTVYAGSCTSNSPDPEKRGINGAALGSAPVLGGKAVERKIQVPALNLVATYNGELVKGATVIVTDTKCQYNTKSVKREFKTDKIGHIAPKESDTTEAVGLPYGEYKVCVSAFISSHYRRAEQTFSVESLASPPLKTVAIPTSQSTAC